MKINLELNDEAATSAIRRLARAGQDLTPLMRNIGEVSPALAGLNRNGGTT